MKNKIIERGRTMLKVKDLVNYGQGNTIAKKILIQSHINEVLSEVARLGIKVSSNDKKDMCIHFLTIDKGICVDTSVEKLIDSLV